MAGSEDPVEQELEETRSDLAAGLDSCRAVLRNYRQLLAEPHPPADNDDSD